MPSKNQGKYSSVNGKFSEAFFREALKAKGVECLDEQYLNYAHDHNFRCLIHIFHTWKAQWRNMKSSTAKSFCKLCNNKWTTEAARIKLQSDGFNLLSEFIDLDGKLVIQCRSCNNIKIMTNAKYCLKRVYICRQCNHGYISKAFNQQTRNHKLDKYKKLLAQNKIIYLDNNFHDVLEYHKYECSVGHKWEAPITELMRSFKRGGNGCQTCVHDKLRLDLNDVKRRYEEMGFEFLDNFYKNANTKYLTRCKKCNHEWKVVLTCILGHQSKCPKCNSRRNEKITGEALKLLLPNIAITHNYFINKKLIIDGELIRNYVWVDYMFYINDQQYFVEYNGAQHYQPTAFYTNKYKLPDDVTKENFRKQQLRDQWVRQHCQTNNIILIEIDGMKYKGKKIKPYLESCLSFNQIPAPIAV